MAGVESGIYAIRHSASGRIYVGSAVSIRARWRVHLSELRGKYHGNGYLQRSFDKYGEAAFEWIVLERCPRAALLAREQHWIEWLDATDRRQGFNIKPRADRPSMAPESIQRTWKTRRARGTDRPTIEQRKARSAAMTGRKLPPEHRQAIGASQAGLKKPATSEALRRRWANYSPAERAAIAAKIGAAQRGRVVPLEKRLRIAETLRGRSLTDEHRAAVGASLRGKKRPEWSRRMREGRWKMPWSARLTARAR